MFDRKPLVARNADGMPRVVSLGRLSKPKETEAETQESLESMRRENARLLDAMFPEEKMVNFLGEQCSGMIPDRETILELWELIDAKECDAIVAEDLSRIFRNPRWQWALVQDAYDAGVRVICFSDNLDTADPTWWTAMSIATVRHGMAVQDGQRRIKRKSTTAFETGGEVGKVRFGYGRVSREDAMAGKYGPKGLRIRRLDDLTRVFDEIRRRLLEGQVPYSIVCWLNAENVQPGQYTTNGHWTLRLLRDNLEHPGLHGSRMFQRELNDQIFGTGKFRRKKNPKPQFQYVPELAHMTREQQEEMLAAVGWRINWGGVKPLSAPNPRKGIPRGHSAWPGQSAICSACQDQMYLSGKFLKCRNASRAQNQTCWNHVLVPKAQLRAFVVNWFVQ